MRPLKGLFPEPVSPPGDSRPARSRRNPQFLLYNYSISGCIGELRHICRVYISFAFNGLTRIFAFCAP
jgi:hypothetical protein